MTVRYVMGDGDDAQYNACLRVFGPDNQFLYLMCFYHVVANVFKYTNGMSMGSKTRVTKDIYDMHFSRSPEQFVQLRDAAIAIWMENPETEQFADYFIQQRLRGKFNQWQCDYMPVGFATMNNPIEQYNTVIKRDYSLRSQLKMGTLFKQLVECSFNESSNGRPFRDQPQISLALKRRVAALEELKTLYEVFPGVGSENDRAESAGLKFVVTLRRPHIFVPSKKRTEEVIAVSAQLGDNYARMEVDGQSQWGWAVDVERRVCSCRYWFKFGQCCHLVLIMQNYGFVDVSGKREFVNRNPARTRRYRDQYENIQEIDAAPAERASTNGHALSLL